MMEYKTVILAHEDVRGGEPIYDTTDLDERMNALARQGWTLSAVRQGSRMHDGTYHYPLAIMEREVRT